MCFFKATSDSLISAFQIPLQDQQLTLCVVMLHVPSATHNQFSLVQKANTLVQPTV